MRSSPGRRAGARRSPSLARARRSLLLVTALVAVVLALSACGSGPSDRPGVATVASTTIPQVSAGGDSPRSRAGSGATTTSSAGAGGSDAPLKFAGCMRSHGIRNFPDPGSGGGFVIPKNAGIDPQSASYQAAQKACQGLLGPLPRMGQGAPASASWMAHMLAVSRCMRRHGIVGFPDPQTSVPSLRPGIGLISDIEGAILVFPASLDRGSPAFTAAAAACGFPLHNH